MKNIIYFFSLIVIVLFCTSCNHYLYTPPEGNLLALSKEKELKASAGLGFSMLDESNHNVQIAYSPMEHFGVAINYFQVGGFSNPANREGDDRNDRVSSTTGEVAFGYYFKRNISGVKDEGTTYESSVNNYLLFDVYGGYGRANLRRSYRVGDINFNSHHYFLQTGVHFQSKVFGLSYSLRGVYLDYLDGQANGRLSDYDLTTVRQLESSPFTFLESSFRVKLGKEKVKVYFSRNWMMSPLQEKQLEYGASSWHVGVLLNIGELFSKTKASPSSTDQ